MRVGDKIAPLHHPIFKPANLPDFLAVARKLVKEIRLKGTFVNTNVFWAASPRAKLLAPPTVQFHSSPSSTVTGILF